MPPAPAPSPASVPRLRLRMVIRGAVQGVGFRPHVFRLAREMGLDGWVVNDHRGVVLEVDGPEAVLTRFSGRLRAAPPPRARVLEVEEEWLEPAGFRAFAIRESLGGGTPVVAVLPDLAVCPACLADVLEPGGRREGYAFTNCTDCGPRFSIIRDLPYDRPATTMADFLQCPACQGEYEDPMDRRFHAQPNACPACGPRLAWWDEEGPAGGVEGDGACIIAAAQALRSGKIVAVQGLGGFHLMVDAGNEPAVARLRTRKNRRTKPLALMVRDAAEAAALVEVGAEALALLTSPAAPIVLLPRRAGAVPAPEGLPPVAPSVAPGNPYLGVMLAYTPLHHLLLRAFGGPVVATSGNRSEEPICTNPDRVRDRLGGIADRYLVHDRPIQRHVDDSVVTVHGPGEIEGVEASRGSGARVLRRARGYAPFPLLMGGETPSLLAVGGHLKNTVAVSRGRQVWMSQHIGDLETAEAQAAFRETVTDLLRLYRVEPVAVVHDLHPDYVSTRWAVSGMEPGLPRVGVQHHHAHMASVLAESGCDADEEALGIVWDGVGYGTDGTVWGGEFLAGGIPEVRRVGHLRPFPLPGGEAAVREPRRSALGLLLEMGLADGAGSHPVPDAFTPEEHRVLARAALRGLNAPRTTSAGRLFDGLSSLLGLCQRSTFEGEGAMMLEFAVDPREAGAYPMELAPASGDARVLDWRPMVLALLSDRRRGLSPGVLAARIHNGLVQGMARMALEAGHETVALSGGCFLNRHLAEGAAATLTRQGHRVLAHRHVPPGDGGLSLGQIAVAAARLSRGPALHPPSPGSAPGSAIPEGV